MSQIRKNFLDSAEMSAERITADYMRHQNQKILITLFTGLASQSSDSPAVKSILKKAREGALSATESEEPLEKAISEGGYEFGRIALSEAMKTDQMRGQ